MPHHEIKYCCKCYATFECKAGNITECQCSTIKLSFEEKIYIEDKYNDCLCIGCLQQLQQEFQLLRKKHFHF